MLKGRDLVASDTNGRSDPYCIVWVGQKNFRTSVQHCTLNPEWMQSMTFLSDALKDFATLKGTTDEVT